tara:strand:- start:165 stop:353 length:189 start_codon:yes stop_codon:yes gene_type:complete
MNFDAAPETTNDSIYKESNAKYTQEMVKYYQEKIKIESTLGHNTVLLEKELDDWKKKDADNQ